MIEEMIESLICPSCGSADLSLSPLPKNVGEGINGVVRCRACPAWYPVEDDLLEFLAPDLGYTDDRMAFWKRYDNELRSLGLKQEQITTGNSFVLERQQQTHFDWYAANAKQNYKDYADTPFWLGADRIAFEPWRRQIRPGASVLEVGCAQGRCTFRFTDLDIRLSAFDISKKMVREAINRYRREKPRAKAFFFVADANRFPFKKETFDYVLIYGVLHHLPDPTNTCRSVALALKPGGIYFGQENNTSVFRFIFDWLQKVLPIWHEEAGPESMISKQMFMKSFAPTGMRVETQTAVFLPPHLLNLLPTAWAYNVLRLTDFIGRSLPFLKHNGGIILIRALKP